MSATLKVTWTQSTTHTRGVSSGSMERTGESLSLDDTLDVFRAALVGMGYSAALAETLRIGGDES
jgi:hypothetical protein